MPPRAVLAQVVDELVENPVTDDELRVLAEVAREAQEQNLEPEQIEARIRDTRFWQLLRLLANNDVRILTYLMALLMIIQVVNDLASRPQPVPAPQVTVNNGVTVDADELAEKVAKQLKDQGICVVPEKTSGQKAKPNK
jgi:hypothetical protein